MKQIKLSKYGILPGHDRDLTSRLNEVLGQVGQGDAELIFESGTYHFYPDAAPEQMMYISNHDDDGVKKVAFFLENCHDLIIDGGGSHFIFHTEIVPFYLNRCDRVTLKNFTVDYARPSYSEGTICAMSSQTMDIHIDPLQYPWEVAGGKLVFMGENFLEEMSLWLEMDPTRKAPACGTRDFWLDGHYGVQPPKAERLRNDKVRLMLTGDDCFLGSSQVGNHLVLRHHPRSHPGFYILDSKNISCENIEVYHATGIGLIAERVCDIVLNRFYVCINPARPRIFTAAADATHFVNCYGKIEIGDCLFENQLDDAINIHGIYYKVKQRLGDHVLRVLLDHSMQKGVPIGHAGDKIALVEPSTLHPGKQLTLQRIERLSPDEFELEFAEKIPCTTDDSAILENITAKPEAMIHHCTFRNNRARGILLTCKTALVTDCLFENAGAALYMEGEAKYWFESGCTDCVELRHNVFRNCSYIKEWGNAPIHIAPGVTRDGNAWYFHRQLILTDNTFECFDDRMLYARHVGKIAMSGNKVVKTKAYCPIEGKDIDLENFGHFSNTMFMEVKENARKNARE